MTLRGSPFVKVKAARLESVGGENKRALGLKYSDVSVT